MKFRILLAVWSCLGSGAAFAVVPDGSAFSLHSSIRLPGEPAQSALDRYRRRLGMGFAQPLTKDTPVGMARRVSQLDLKLIPQWNPAADPREAFGKVRDSRFIADPEHQGFMRRSSWLYPDDGCFARAALMGQNLEKWGYVRPAKAFIFGNLNVTTSNSPSGSVSWWYHVVPIVLIGGVPVVFDPAIHPKALLGLKDWVMTMTNDPNKITIAICNPKSYSPSSPCMDMAHSSDEEALRDQVGFMGREWSRLERLRRDPTKELGDFPPWGSFAGRAWMGAR